MNAAQHFAEAERLTARAEEYLDQSDSPMSDADRKSLLLKALLTESLAHDHIDLASLASTSRSISPAQAEAVNE